MIKTGLETTFVITILCAIAFTIVLHYTQGDYYLFMVPLIIFFVFTGPLLALNLLYGFIFIKKPQKSLRNKRIIMLIIGTALAILIWSLIDSWQWQKRHELSEWTLGSADTWASQSQAVLGAMIFIPICVANALLFDYFEYKRLKMKT